MQSSGIAIFQANVYVREGPSVTTKSVAQYYIGETVRYDSIVNNEGRKWISYIGRSGNRRYCCAVDTDGSVYINLGEAQQSSSSSFGGTTGIPGIPRQGEFPQRGIAVSGCCFLSSCVKGGCTTKEQCIQAFNWATEKGKVRVGDAYVSCGRENLARDISNHFGLTFHDNYEIYQNSKKTHFYIRVNGKEIFNSGGLGFAL